MWNKKKSNAAVIEPPIDIREKMNKTLADLQTAIEGSTERRNTQEKILGRWKSRASRAKVIIEQTSGDGKAAAEMLLSQAEGYVETHLKALVDESEHLNLLTEQYRSMEESVKRLDAVNRVKVLQERISSIPATSSQKVISGDDEKMQFDSREIEKNVHMINALIELRKGE